MDADGSRRFTIADGLITIAGFAAGFGLVRAVSPDLTPGRVWEAITNPRDGWSAWYAFGLFLELGVIFVIPFVAGWAPACLMLQVVGPRPPWRRLVRRPGFIACLIATAVVIVSLAIALACIGFSIWEIGSLPGEYWKVMIPAGIIGGWGILWSWATMKLCRASRSEPAWRDRLGRATGVVGIVVGLICVASCYLALN